jgi:hypothetical protein
MKIDARRMPIYQYVHSLFYKKVTNSIFPIEIPTGLDDKEKSKGFMVIRMGNIRDKSEFDLNAYATVRVTVEMYIPPKTRGRVNDTAYSEAEEKITSIIENEIETPTGKYSISSDGILSTDTIYDENDNMFFVYMKSFVVSITN